MYWWHVHHASRPWCRVYTARSPAYQEARRLSEADYGKVGVYSSDYDEQTCPYRDLMRGTNMTSPAMVRLPDGSDINSADLTCESCGADMAGHACGGAAGTTGSVTYSRSTGPRKPVSAHPTCAHCGGRVHFNMGATAVNAECLNRQYSLDVGEMTDPSARLPVLTIERMKDIVEWAAALASPPTYGKMESAAGGAGTYSGLRVKTGRKKKVAPAAPGAQIQDMAADEAINADESEAPVKAKKSRKGKGKTTVIVSPTVDASEEMVLDPEATNGSDVVEQAEEVAATAEANVPNEEQARKDRAERRAARKALLAGKR
jgi:hypothetical protein